MQSENRSCRWSKVASLVLGRDCELVGDAYRQSGDDLCQTAGFRQRFELSVCQYAVRDPIVED